jgi:hypothetical protein
VDPRLRLPLLHIEFKGSCALMGEKPIGGKVVVDSRNGQSASIIQPLEPLGITENNSMEVAKDRAYVEKGKGLLKLASGLSWSFH